MTAQTHTTLYEGATVKVELWEHGQILSVRYDPENLDKAQFAIAESIISARLGDCDPTPDEEFIISSNNWVLLCWRTAAFSGIVTS